MKLWNELCTAKLLTCSERYVKTSQKEINSIDFKEIIRFFTSSTQDKEAFMDYSEIIFLISQQKHTLWPLIRTV